MVYLDTNCLIRLITNDDPIKANKVEKILLNNEFSISETVFPELEYVLIKSYKSNRTAVLDSFKSLLANRRGMISKFVKKAVDYYEESNLDMADCLVAAHSLSGQLASFDKKLLGLAGVKKYWK